MQIFPCSILYIPGTWVWLIGYVCAWVGDNCKTYDKTRAVNFEAMKANQFAEPSCIKMLLDAGMMKTYPKCVLKLANVDLGCYNVMECTPCSWIFFTSCVFHAAIRRSRDSAPSLHLNLFLWKTFLYPCFCNFYGVQAVHSWVNSKLSRLCTTKAILHLQLHRLCSRVHSVQRYQSFHCQI